MMDVCGLIAACSFGEGTMAVTFSKLVVGVNSVGAARVTSSGTAQAETKNARHMAKRGINRFITTLPPVLMAGTR